MERSPLVITLGHAIVDVLAHTSDELVAGFGLAKATMTLVDVEQAEKIYEAISSTGSTTEVSGGSAANTAACLASFDTPVAFVGKVADDALGETFIRDIRAAGVRFGVPPAKGGVGTGRSLIMVTPDAEKTMCTWLGTGAEVGPADLDEDAVSAAEVVYIEGYLYDTSPRTELIEAAVSTARASGTSVALSLSDPAWVEFRGEALGRLLDRVDVLFANEAEACGLAGVTTARAAVEALARRCATVAVTLGAAGALVAGGGRVIEVPAAEVEAVVDTTGAGDSYAGGFLSGLVRGADLEQCGRLGSLAAAEIVGHMGARPQRSLADVAAGAGLA